MTSGSLLSLGSTVISRDLVDAVTAGNTQIIFSVIFTYIGVGIGQIFINVIRTHCPNARIVILAPIQRAADRVSLWNYVKNELEAANHFACPAINMFQDVGIMQEIEAVEHKYLSDGLHPNADGKKLMGAIISSKLLGIYNY